MKIWRILLVLLSASTFLSACQAAPASQSAADTRPVVFVSVPPQRYFVERIAGDTVNVQVMVPVGSEPHTYEPKPEQMAALASARLYFRIDDAFENIWLGRIRETNPNMEIVDTAAGIQRRTLESDPAHPGEGGPDPHIWLAPKLVAVQAQAMHDALAALLPQNASLYDANLQAFQQDLTALDQELQQKFSGFTQRSFMVYHPSWGYFADAYHLKQIPIEAGGTEPSAAEMAQIITQAKDLNIHVIFAEPEFSSRAAQTIADEIKGQVVLISPLAEDWLKNMRTVGDALAAGLR